MERLLISCVCDHFAVLLDHSCHINLHKKMEMYFPFPFRHSPGKTTNYNWLEEKRFLIKVVQ